MSPLELHGPEGCEVRHLTGEQRFNALRSKRAAQGYDVGSVQPVMAPQALWNFLRQCRGADLKRARQTEGFRSEVEIAARLTVTLGEAQAFLASISGAPTIEHRAPDLWRWIEPNPKRSLMQRLSSWLGWDVRP